MNLDRTTLAVNLVLKPLSVAGAWYMLHNLHYTLLAPNNETVILLSDIVFLLLSIIWSYVIMDKLEKHGVWWWVLLLGAGMGATYSITAYGQYEKAYQNALNANSLYLEAKKYNERTFYSESFKEKLLLKYEASKKVLVHLDVKIKKALNDYKSNFNEENLASTLKALKRNDKSSYMEKVRDVSNKGYQLTSPLYLARAIYAEELKRLEFMVDDAQNTKKYLEAKALVSSAKSKYENYTQKAIIAKKKTYEKIIDEQKVLTKEGLFFSLDMLVKIWLSIGFVLEIFGSPLAMWLALATRNKEEVMEAVAQATVAEENSINGILTQICNHSKMMELAQEKKLKNRLGDLESFWATFFNFLVFAIEKEVAFSEVPVKSKVDETDTDYLHGWSMQNAKGKPQRTVRLRDGSVYTPYKSSPAKWSAEIKKMLENYHYSTIDTEDVKNIISLKLASS